LFESLFEATVEQLLVAVRLTLAAGITNMFRILGTVSSSLLLFDPLVC